MCCRITAFFFALYFLMATQDIAVDGWALTMLSRKNRGRGPVCNSIGQNIGYFLSFVGFLALNDGESSDRFWRPLLRLPRLPPGEPLRGLVSLGGFVRFMGYFMLVTTTAVALFKHEHDSGRSVGIKGNGGGSSSSSRGFFDRDVERPQLPLALLASDRMEQQQQDGNYNYNSEETEEEEIGDELDASEIGLKETYHRLWAVCKLPAVRNLFMILLTYRLPTSLTGKAPSSAAGLSISASRRWVPFFLAVAIAPVVLTPLALSFSLFQTTSNSLKLSSWAFPNQQRRCYRRR
jgi:PAT family acetyl-CoA transporter-like MFS transporter 1